MMSIFYKEKQKDMLLNYKSTEHVQKVFNKENRKAYKSNARTKKVNIVKRKKDIEQI